MIPLIITISIVVIEGILLFFQIKTTEKWRNKAESLRNNIRILESHTEAIRLVKEKGSEIKEKIKRAKTDEEIYDIVADIAKLNNKRLLHE